MKTKTLLKLCMFVLGAASVLTAQQSLIATTLAVSMTERGIGATSQSQVNLASTSGVNLSRNDQPVTLLYVDQELMGILAPVVGTTNQFTVLRGLSGTATQAHLSGAPVLVWSDQVNDHLYGRLGGFQGSDPKTPSCTPGNTMLPWVNVTTGAQWLCSSISNTWVPGWNNPATKRPTAAVASAAGLITPSGPLFHITGALGITGFNIPIGFNATATGGDSFCVIPDGAFTTTTANNIAVASTAVVSKPLCWQWDAGTSKFIPSY